jgi:hypothetical protein
MVQDEDYEQEKYPVSRHEHVLKHLKQLIPKNQQLGQHPTKYMSERIVRSQSKKQKQV